MDDRWNDEREAIVKRGVAEGLTYSQIQAQLNKLLRGGEEPFSRSAVCGKVMRLGLNKRITMRYRAKPAKPKRRPKPAQRRWARPEKPAAKIEIDTHASYKAALERVAKMDKNVDRSKLIRIEDLEPHHCRQYHGDPKHDPGGYCWRHRVPGLPYCEAHAAINIPSAVPAERVEELAKELEVA